MDVALTLLNIQDTIWLSGNCAIQFLKSRLVAERLPYMTIKKATQESLERKKRMANINLRFDMEGAGGRVFHEFRNFEPFEIELAIDFISWTCISMQLNITSTTIWIPGLCHTFRNNNLLKWKLYASTGIQKKTNKKTAMLVKCANLLIKTKSNYKEKL